MYYYYNRLVLQPSIFEHSRYGPLARVEAPAAVVAQAEHVTVHHCRHHGTCTAKSKGLGGRGGGWLGNHAAEDVLVLQQYS